jgi:protein-S-isoprenylcysteine O-methyltransferase Ste14
MLYNLLAGGKSGPSMNGARDASSPFIWPPTIFGAAVVGAALLWWLVPLPFLPTRAWIALRLLGGLFIVGGIALALSAEQAFRRAGTAAKPTEPTTAIVAEGVFRYTRNPMYLGMTVILVGLGFATDCLWFFIAAPVAVVAVTKLAIEREERYLEQKFGAAYLDYKARIRRWL